MNPILPRNTPLKRTAMKKKRSKPRRNEPTDAEKAAIRHQVYMESGGRCQLNFPGCDRGVLPENYPDARFRWHLVHKQAKRRFGWDRENLCGGCNHCHIEVLHQYGPSGVKPCPSKRDGSAYLATISEDACL